MNPVDFGVAVHTAEGPTLQVRSSVDPWTGVRGVAVSFSARAETSGGPAYLTPQQVPDLIEALEAVRDHVQATAGDPDVKPTSSLLTPKFRADLPPKQRRSVLGEFGAQLTAAPGMWAVHPSAPFSTDESAASTASRISRGHSKAFPPTLFQAEARGRDVYVRYVPRSRR